MSTQDSIVQSVTGDQRFDPGHEKKVFRDRILHSPQTPGEFIDIGEGMPLTNERVHLREAAVLKRHVRRASLAKLACKEAGLKLPKPPSPSTSTGSSAESTMRSTLSTSWLHEASLASRKPSELAIDKPDAQSPLNPERSAIMRLHQKRERTIRTDLGTKPFDSRWPRVLMSCGGPKGLWLKLHAQILQGRASIDANVAVHILLD
ncbi:hypothetical protein [Bradyrhizobium sp. 38]|uniref:hypothetical protein n=1 Tax=Bradyrhizobium sp. 38 TaxID=2782672 RepID=UPI003211C504